MSQFLQSLLDGVSHIFTLDAVDHILYLLVLTASFDSSKLRKIFWLVTAFTIGHTLTFILGALDYLPFVRSWIEQMIPLTIMITAILNWKKKERRPKKSTENLMYLTAVFFGAIHGCAIGNTIQAKIKMNMGLTEGDSFLAQFLGFNIGVELAQIAVVLIILFVQLLLMNMLRIKLVDWKKVVSGIAFGGALVILMNYL